MDEYNPHDVQNVKTPNQIGGEETTEAGANIVTPDPDAGTKPIKADESIPTATSTEATGTVITLVDLSALTTRDSHYFREQLDEENVEGLARAYFENKVAMDQGKEPIHDIPPIKVWCDPDNGELVMLGGNHRTKGATLAGLTTIPAIVYHCSENEAFVIGMKDNATHGLKPSRGDLKHMIKKALERFPYKSLRTLAEELKCSLSRVSEVSNELYDCGQLERPKTRIGKDNKEYTVNRRSRKTRPSEDTSKNVPLGIKGSEWTLEERKQHAYDHIEHLVDDLSERDSADFLEGFIKRCEYMYNYRAGIVKNNVAPKATDQSTKET